MPALALTEPEYPMRGKQALPRQTAFAQWLYDARTNRGLTMTALADRAGISHARIVQLEKGNAPTRDMVERLVAALMGDDPEGHVFRALLNAGIKAAFPRPEDAEGSGADPDYPHITYPENFKELPPDIKRMIGGHLQTVVDDMTRRSRHLVGGHEPED